MCIYLIFCWPEYDSLKTVRQRLISASDGHLKKTKLPGLLKGKIKYQFTATIWQYSSLKGSWYFISLPIEISNEIRENLKWQEEGWGRLKATAIINNTEWETAIWFDSKMKTYLLPLKAEIRRKENLEIEKNINTVIWI